ncbi:hypothetical protein AMV011 [Betaentomopoxvirus amoorei]|uniref:AMV011 n=1 Tax=Amsacta moorei entomopoxvirus TaxID=28321 RepID=Q9EN35_AMEPV|nr:hypothetical protein AMV011 [Amsacta moorei entomopoxvirus]AAG02717.1 AMV011 [Amsacta moorei entomopoxvirus]
MDKYIKNILEMSTLQYKYNNKQYMYIKDNITYSKYFIKYSKYIINKIKNNIYSKKYKIRILKKNINIIYELKLLFVYNCDKLIDCISDYDDYVNKNNIIMNDYINMIINCNKKQNIELIKIINDNFDKIIYNYDISLNFIEKILNNINNVF